MKKNRKEKLIDLGVECLAESLLEFAKKSDMAHSMVEQLIATPTENTQHLKKKISDLKYPNYSFDWGETDGFSDDLATFLEDLKACVTDPITGMEMVASFYETDQSALENCGDSDGEVWDIYACDAQQLFAEYASRCEDKEKVGDIIIRLNLNDNYGTRDTLLDNATDFLPEPAIRSMITKLQKMAENGKKGDSLTTSCYRMIEPLAEQINDAKLYEKAKIAAWDKVSPSSLVDIARVYLKSGDVETAFLWTNKIPKGDRHQTHGLEPLLLKIYKLQGNHGKLAELLSQKLQKHRCLDNLQEMLEVVGNDKRDDIISAEIYLIFKNSTLNTTDASFLISIGKINMADEYLQKWANKFKGACYNTLLPLATAMESKNCNLSASLLYRSLLLSILERGNSQAYDHGARYLHKLDKLSKGIIEWNRFTNHQKFKEQITQDHGRKWSFWKKYN